jgi:toxin FitB
VIILDTNVISAIMTPDANLVVFDWLDRQVPQSLWITAISVFEIRFGLETLPQGRRRSSYETAFQAFLRDDVGGRILSFDQIAAEKSATLAAYRRRTGRAIDAYDAHIAGIVLARRARLATRNLRHFADTGLKLVNPWDG